MFCIFCTSYYMFFMSNYVFCISNYMFSRLMMSLALSDLLYLASSAWVFSCPLLWPDISTTHMFAYSVTFMLPLAHTGLTGTRHIFVYSVTFMLPLTHTGLTGTRHMFAYSVTFMLPLAHTPKKYLIT